MLGLKLEVENSSSSSTHYYPARPTILTTTTTILPPPPPSSAATPLSTTGTTAEHALSSQPPAEGHTKKTMATASSSIAASQHRISASQQMLASCSGGLVTAALMTPFDVIKIRIQSAAFAAAANSQCPKCLVYFNGLMDHVCPASCKPFTPRPAYRLNGNGASFSKSLIQIVRHEGPFALWSGLPPTLLMAIPNTVIYFTSYDNLKAAFGYSPPAAGTVDVSLTIPFAAGAIARFAAVTVISPIELVRTKMQSKSMSYDQVGSAVRDALRQGGWRSLWSGWVPSILRDVPFSGLYFLGYELFKIQYSRLLSERGETSSSSSTFDAKVNFASGATAAFFATILTQPFDVLKTRRQIQLGEANFGAISRAESTWRTAAHLVRLHGAMGLYAGLVPRLVKVMPACAIMITSYEYFKEAFSARNKRNAL